MKYHETDKALQLFCAKLEIDEIHTITKNTLN
jgi:hypothetical protein